MNPAWRPTKRDWIDTVILGAVIGFVVLGIGSRIGMRGIAVAQGQPGGFTWGGTSSVLFMGVVAGVGGAVALVGARSLRRLPQVARGALYWGVLIFLTARGLNPIDMTRVAWLAPWVLVYGVALQYISCRVAARRRIAAPQPV
jgi:hypothetical protein